MHLILDTGRSRWRLALAGAVLMAATAAGTGGAGAASDAPRLQNLETQAARLGDELQTLDAGMRALLPSSARAQAASDARPLLVAQSNQDIAAVNVRLGQLEEQVRTMTGQIEGLQFQMTQLQTLMERMQKDYDFRLQQLEGGSPGKTDAAPQSGGDMPPAGASQDQNPSAPAGQEFGIPDNPDPNAVELGVPDNPDVGEQDLQMDGQSAIGGSGPNDLQRGAPPQTLGTLPADGLTLGNDQPLDLGGGQSGIVPETGAVASPADADAQYKAGYDAVARGDYAFAEEQFRQFISLFPDHPRAPDATNWLGEALIRDGAYDEAADVLLTGFQAYPDSAQAPNMLLNLGVALQGAGEHDTACRTFEEVRKRYPEMSEAFRGKLNDQVTSSQC